QASASRSRKPTRHRQAARRRPLGRRRRFRLRSEDRRAQGHYGASFSKPSYYDLLHGSWANALVMPWKHGLEQRHVFVSALSSAAPQRTHSRERQRST